MDFWRNRVRHQLNTHHSGLLKDYSEAQAQYTSFRASEGIQWAIGSVHIIQSFWRNKVRHRLSTHHSEFLREKVRHRLSTHHSVLLKEYGQTGSVHIIQYFWRNTVRHRISTHHSVLLKEYSEAQDQYTLFSTSDGIQWGTVTLKCHAAYVGAQSNLREGLKVTVASENLICQEGVGWKQNGWESGRHCLCGLGPINFTWLQYRSGPQNRVVSYALITATPQQHNCWNSITPKQVFIRVEWHLKKVFFWFHVEHLSSSQFAADGNLRLQL
jgi:hypothetical protein